MRKDGGDIVSDDDGVTNNGQGHGDRPTPPALPKPRQERAQATQSAIIQAAATVFAERGYARTTLDVVAVEAGVTKGALYFHFSSKRDLANAVIAEETRLTALRAQETLDAGYSVIETMIRLHRNLAAQIVDDAVVAAGVKLTTEELVAQLDISAPYDLWTDLTVDLLRRGVENGELRSGLDPEKLSRFVVGAFVGVNLVSNSLGHGPDLFVRVREMWEILISGIAAPEYVEASQLLPALIRP